MSPEEADPSWDFENEFGKDPLGPVDEFAEFFAEPAPVHDAVVADQESPVAEMQALIDQFRQADLHELQDPRHKRIIDELGHLAFSNLADVFEESIVMEYGGEDDDGEPILVPRPRLTIANIKQLPESVQRAIKKIKITRKMDGDVIEVELYDKNISLDKLMRHHGLLEKDNTQKAKSTADSFIDMMFAQTEAQGLLSPVRDAVHRPDPSDDF